MKQFDSNTLVPRIAPTISIKEAELMARRRGNQNGTLYIESGLWKAQGATGMTKAYDWADYRVVPPEDLTSRDFDALRAIRQFPDAPVVCFMPRVDPQDDPRRSWPSAENFQCPELSTVWLHRLDDGCFVCRDSGRRYSPRQGVGQYEPVRPSTAPEKPTIPASSQPEGKIEDSGK